MWLPLAALERNFMNFRLNTFATIFIFRLASYCAIADAPPDQPSMPPKLGESLTGVVDFAATLTGEKGKPESMIKVYIKNISTSALSLIDSSRTDQGFLFFTVDSKGGKHLLHDHDPHHGKGTRLQQIAASMESNWVEEIGPNETISRTISISTTDLALIKSRAIQCSFSIINPNTGQLYRINSSPKMLVAEP